MSISVIGGGAFGTALAVTLSRQTPVALWAREASTIQRARQNTRRLPGVDFPRELSVEPNLESALAAEVLLMALPMQVLGTFVSTHDLRGRIVVACCKGIDLETGRGPSAVLGAAKHVAVLTGPSFAADIARGLPTALTLACANDSVVRDLQEKLSTPTLRLYRSTDVIGAELGGALKNVIAIACGAVMGAGLGDSARAALMTRGFSEMQRVAAAFGAQSDTLMGLSGNIRIKCSSGTKSKTQAVVT